MERSDEFGWVFVFIAIAVYAIVALTNALDLDYATGSKILWGGIVVVTAITAMTFLDFSIERILSVLLVGLWVALWPALNFLGVPPSNNDTNQPLLDVAWYATSLGQWVVAACLGLVGYFIPSVPRRR